MPMPCVLIGAQFLQAPPTGWELVCCQVNSHSTTEWLVVSIETHNLNLKNTDHLITQLGEIESIETKCV